MSSQHDRKRVEKLQEQHSEIRKLTEDLVRGRSTNDTRELIARLDALLTRHFALEESDGYFAEELAIAPQLAHAAAGLLKEHQEILARVKQVGASSRAGSATDSLDQEVRDLVQQLNDHEAAENRLVQKVYLQDQGGG